MGTPAAFCYLGLLVGLLVVLQSVHFLWNILSDTRHRKWFQRELAEQGLSEKDMSCVAILVNTLPGIEPCILD
jgi:hypothetical protein